jgi:hypothetical protein
MGQGRTGIAEAVRCWAASYNVPPYGRLQQFQNDKTPPSVWYSVAVQNITYRHRVVKRTRGDTISKRVILFVEACEQVGVELFGAERLADRR